MIILKFFDVNQDKEVVSCSRYRVEKVATDKTIVTAFLTPADSHGTEYYITQGDWVCMYAENLAGKTTDKVVND